MHFSYRSFFVWISFNFVPSQCVISFIRKLTMCTVRILFGFYSLLLTSARSVNVFEHWINVSDAAPHSLSVYSFVIVSRSTIDWQISAGTQCLTAPYFQWTHTYYAGYLEILFEWEWNLFTFLYMYDLLWLTKVMNVRNLNGFELNISVVYPQLMYY